MANTSLPNGLRVVSDTVHGAATASIGLWLDRGSRHETYDQSGLAHMLEHMVFKGTQRRSAQTIAETLENVGGHLNAYTSRETTAYYARVLSEHTPLAVEILTDLATGAKIPHADLDIERHIILTELGEMLDTPDDLIFEHFQTTAFPNHGLGRSVLGRRDVIESITADDLQNYYSWMQNPNGLILVGAGGVDHAMLVDHAERELGHLKGRERRHFTAPVYSGGLSLHSRDLEQVHVAIGFKGAGQCDDDFYIQNALAVVLGGGAASRLFQNLREARGLAYTVGSFLSAYTDTGLFVIHAGTTADNLPIFIEKTGSVLDEMEKDITDNELRRAKNQLKAAMLMNQESSFSRAENIANQLLVLGRTVSVEDMTRKIDVITTAQLKVALKGLRASKPTFAAIGPLHNMPDQADVYRCFQGC